MTQFRYWTVSQQKTFHTDILTVWKHKVVTWYLPSDMRAGIDEDSLKVFGELWSFLLAVLDDIVGQVEERQLPAAFSWRTCKYIPLKSCFKICEGKSNLAIRYFAMKSNSLHYCTCFSSTYLSTLVLTYLLYILSMSTQWQWADRFFDNKSYSSLDKQ